MGRGTLAAPHPCPCLQLPQFPVCWDACWPAAPLVRYKDCRIWTGRPNSIGSAHYARAPRQRTDQKPLLGPRLHPSLRWPGSSARQYVHQPAAPPVGRQNSRLRTCHGIWTGHATCTDNGCCPPAPRRSTGQAPRRPRARRVNLWTTATVASYQGDQGAPPQSHPHCRRTLPPPDAYHVNTRKEDGWGLALNQWAA